MDWYRDIEDSRFLYRYGNFEKIAIVSPVEINKYCTLVFKQQGGRINLAAISDLDIKKGDNLYFVTTRLLSQHQDEYIDFKSNSLNKNDDGWACGSCNVIVIAPHSIYGSNMDELGVSILWRPIY